MPGATAVIMTNPDLSTVVEASGGGHVPDFPQVAE